MPLLAPIINIPLSDGSGTVAADLATTAANGTYVGSPTLNADSGAYNTGTTVKCFTGLDHTKYVSIPPTKMPFAGATSANGWTMTFQLQATSSGPVGGGFPFCKMGMSSIDATFTDSWRFQNGYVFYLHGTRSSPTTNAITFQMYGATVNDLSFIAGTTSGTQFDQKVHRVTVTYDPSVGSGTLSLYLDDVLLGTTTGATANLPTVAGYFGVGCVLSGATTPANAMGDPNFPFKIFNFRVYARPLAVGDIRSLDDSYHGNKNEIIEAAGRTVGLSFLRKARTRPVLVISSMDSNGARNTKTRAGKLDHGHVLTVPRMLKRAIGDVGLLGFILGCNSTLSSGFGGDNAAPQRGWMGILEDQSLLGTYLTGGSVPAWVQAKHVGEWNRIDEGGNNPDGDDAHGWTANDGFMWNTRYVNTAVTIAAGAGGGSRLVLDATHPDWPFAPNANISLYQYLGGAGTCYPHFEIGGTSYPTSAPARPAGSAAWDASPNEVALGTNLNGTSGFYSLAKTGSALVGPIAGGPVAIMDKSRTSGIVFAPFWIKGAFAGTHMVRGMVDVQTRYTKIAAAMADLIRIIFAATGQLPIILGLWEQGGNDFVFPNTTMDSYTYTPAYDASGTFVGAPVIGTDSTNKSGSIIGHRQNISTWRAMLRDAYLGCGVAGVHKDDFFCMLGPYHRGSDSVVDQQRQVKSRAEREVCDLVTDTFRVDGIVAVDALQMGSIGGYASDGEAHASYDGFVRLADTCGDALAALLDSQTIVVRNQPMQHRPVKNAAYTLAFTLFTYAGKIDTASTPTITISKDGAAFVASAGTLTSLGGGAWQYAATAGEMNCARAVLKIVTSGSGPDDSIILMPMDPATQSTLAYARLDATIPEASGVPDTANTSIQSIVAFLGAANINQRVVDQTTDKVRNAAGTVIGTGSLSYNSGTKTTTKGKYT